MKQYVLLFVLLLSPLKASLFTEWVDVIVEVKDEITNEKSFMISTEKALPTEKMDYPYEEINIFSTIVVLCSEDGTEEAYVALYFDEYLDEINKDIELEGIDVGGYNYILTQGRWDDEVQEIIFLEYPYFEGKLLYFFDTKNAISNIKNSKQFIAEIPLWKYGSVYFKYSVTGGREKLSELRKKCRGN